MSVYIVFTDPVVRMIHTADTQHAENTDHIYMTYNLGDL